MALFFIVCAFLLMALAIDTYRQVKKYKNTDK